MGIISDLLNTEFTSDDELREAIIAVTLDTRASIEREYFFDNGVGYTDSTYGTQVTFTDILHPSDATRWVQGTELHSRDTTRGPQDVKVFIPVGTLFWTDPSDDDGLRTWDRRLVIAYQNSISDITSFSVEGFRVEGCSDAYFHLLRRGRSMGVFQ